MEDRKGTRIQSVSRAARLLRLVARLPEEERSATRFAEELGTSVPTAYHLLNTLVDAGLLARDERKTYMFGVAMDVLSAAHARQSSPPPELVAPLRGIITATGETAYFSAWRNGEPVVLAQLSGTHAVQVANLRTGYGGAANARASGKVLLAFTTTEERERYLAMHPLEPATPHTIVDPDDFRKELARVAREGYSTEIEEFSEGVACVAVPVWSDTVLLGCYTISAPVERFSSRRDTYLDALRAATSEFAGA
ncbi:IclR family transcriptional regulator [Pseudonocardia xishanensis]|uniref:IclR family transcriptional regulator C-terminal domain-containing protein n=1 Tax=Pseudonocardia xishanensis TaxID=630995 RepID=A0ABP8RVW6_9PSEU